MMSELVMKSSQVHNTFDFGLFKDDFYPEKDLTTEKTQFRVINKNRAIFSSLINS